MKFWQEPTIAYKRTIGEENWVIYQVSRFRYMYIHEMNYISPSGKPTTITMEMAEKAYFHFLWFAKRYVDSQADAAVSRLAVDELRLAGHGK